MSALPRSFDVPGGAAFVAACTALALSRGGLPASVSQLDALADAIGNLAPLSHPGIAELGPLIALAGEVVAAQIAASENDFSQARWDLCTALFLFWQARSCPDFHEPGPQRFGRVFPDRFSQESHHVTAS